MTHSRNNVLQSYNTEHYSNSENILLLKKSLKECRRLMEIFVARLKSDGNLIQNCHA